MFGDYTPILSDVMKFAITLLSILNPIGVIPIYLSLTERYSDEGVRNLTRTCVLTVMVTIFLTLAIGQQILNFFGISIASFTVGGGFLICSMAFSMISAKQSQAKINTEEMEDFSDDREVGIVPLAIPLLAGPGVMSTSIIQAKSFTTTLHWVGAFIVVLLVGALIYVVFSSGKKIANRLGQVGLNVMTRIMGIILLAISIELISRGLLDIFPGLAGS